MIQVAVSNSTEHTRGCYTYSYPMPSQCWVNLDHMKETPVGIKHKQLCHKQMQEHNPSFLR